MPVLVTAAERPLARLIATRLLEDGGEVRVVADGDVSHLRAAGAFVATGSGDDEGLIEAAAQDVHTVVHVGGSLVDEPAQIASHAAVVARAAEQAGVRRLIGLSVSGAAADAADPFRRAKAAAEAEFAAAEVPSVVIRCSLVDTPAVRDVLITAGLGPEARHARIAPVRVQDIIEVVAAFDRARSRASTGHLVVAADGPERCTVASWLERYGAVTPGRGGLLGRRLADADRAARLETILEGPWWSQDASIVDAWTFTGITPGGPPATDPI